MADPRATRVMLRRTLEELFHVLITNDLVTRFVREGRYAWRANLRLARARRSRRTARRERQ